MLKRTGTLKKSPLKKTGNALKRKPMVKKAPDPKYLADRKAQSDADWKFYEQIWNSRPHVCQVTGDPIWGELRSTYIDHLLEKGVEKYAHLRYEPDNVIVISERAHTLKTNGYALPKHKELIEETKKKYNII